MEQRFGLPDALRRLRDAHGVSTSYNRLIAAVYESRVPAQREGGRWYISADDLPAVAAAMRDASASKAA